MNWAKIKEKYPKGFNKFLYWDGTFDDKEAVLKAYSLIYPDRKLYDFFDENEIYVEIQIDRTLEAKYAPFIHHGCIYDYTGPIEDLYRDDEWDSWQDEYLYRTRTEAESVALTKAFEILEKKIK